MNINFNEPITPPLPQISSAKDVMKELYEPYTAKNIFTQLIQRIKLFDKALDQEHQLGMQLVSFGQSIQFIVSRLGYMDPSIIWFEGILPDGSNVQLVQHVNQISFLMIAVKRQNPEKPKAPIGFYRSTQQNKQGFEEFDSTQISEQESAATKE